MANGYISRWAKAKEPERQHMIDFWFTSRPENAAYWKEREDAERDLPIFENQSITIASAQGHLHVLSGFQVEDSPSGQFVVFCEAPFIPANEPIPD